MKASTVVKLQIAVQVIVVPALLVMFALLANGCTPDMPRGSVELNAGPALDVAFAALGRSDVAHPPAVYGVPLDCSDSTGQGFWLDGGCRGGFTDPTGIYLPLTAGARYSHHLAHEARHWIVGGDFDPRHASPGFYADAAAASAALARSPGDVIVVGVGGFERTVGQ
jgi:hypothetical protein